MNILSTRVIRTTALSGLAAIGFAGAGLAQEAGPVDPEAVAAVKAMSEALRGLDAMTIEADLVREVVLETGQKLTMVERLLVDADSPDRLRMEKTTPERARVFYFDGETVTIWGPKNRYYTSVAFKGSTREMVLDNAETYGLELPLADLFLWSGSEEEVAAIKEAFYVGRAQFGDRICEQWGFRQDEVDWEIWIDEAAGNLPCGYSITDLSDAAHPVFRAVVRITPRAEIADGRFTFTPPEDALFIPLAEASDTKP